MRKLLIVAILCLCFTLPLMAESMGVNYGSLKIGGILQTTYTADFDSAVATQNYFKMNRARLLFWGTIVPDKVKFFIQTEAVQKTTGGVVVAPFLLDTKLQLNYIPMTTLTFGRFLPAFTHYMPSSTAKLDMINYPLIVTGTHPLNIHYGMAIPIGYAMWRQVGFQADVKTDYVDGTLGLFNGYPSNNWSDNNDAKDLLVRVAAKPVDFVQIIGYGWFGNMLFAEDSVESDFAHNRFGGGILVNKALANEMSIVFNAEVVMGSDEYMVDSTMSSMGFYAHLGFNLNPKHEILFRYDSFDPNTDSESKGDALSLITIGYNFRIDADHAKASVNYIMVKPEDPEEGTMGDDFEWWNMDKIVAQLSFFF